MSDPEQPTTCLPNPASDTASHSSTIGGRVDGWTADGQEWTVFQHQVRQVPHKEKSSTDPTVMRLTAHNPPPGSIFASEDGSAKCLDYIPAKGNAFAGNFPVTFAPPIFLDGCSTQKGSLMSFYIERPDGETAPRQDYQYHRCRLRLEGSKPDMPPDIIYRGLGSEFQVSEDLCNILLKRTKTSVKADLYYSERSFSIDPRLQSGSKCTTMTITMAGQPAIFLYPKEAAKGPPQEAQLMVLRPVNSLDEEENGTDETALKDLVDNFNVFEATYYARVPPVDTTMNWSQETITTASV